MKLVKRGPDGRIHPETYYTSDFRFEVEKGVVGWNANEKDRYGHYRYSFTCETLREVRESLDSEY